MIHAVIMAGGAGERFWPLSRTENPKQLLKLAGPKTMIELTADRIKPLADGKRTWVVTTARQATAIRRLLPAVPASNILREPVGRNTAPAIATAAYSIARRDKEAIMVVLPADHVISPPGGFRKTIRAAARRASRGSSLITIGVEPDFASTGYGYIKRGKKISAAGERPFYAVEKFIEKPSRARALRFIRSPLYSWNSGIFVWSAGAIIEALEKHLPGVSKRLRPVLSLPLSKIPDFLRKTYPGLPSISIDYGVMEKHGNVLVTTASFRWDDVGSWAALGKYLSRDPAGNRRRGKLVAHQASGCTVFSTEPLIGLVGVSDLIVVATEDAVLVCSRERAQDVKKLVQSLRRNPRYRSYL